MAPKLAVPVVVKPAAVIAPTTVMVSTDRDVNIFIRGCLHANDVSTYDLLYSSINADESSFNVSLLSTSAFV